MMPPVHRKRQDFSPVSTQLTTGDSESGSKTRNRAFGSLEDQAFLGKVLAGAAGFFVLLPPNEAETGDYFAAQRRASDAIAGAVKNSAVPHVVMLSSLGAELADGTGPIKSLHYLENALRATGTKLTAIRACYFQENIASVIRAARQAGIFPNFLPSAETPIPMIATQDIGRLGAKLLQSPHQAGETVDLLGRKLYHLNYAHRRGCQRAAEA